MVDGTIRDNVKVGMEVKIVLKKDQKSGKMTQGIVKDFLQNHQNITEELK